MRAMRFGRQHNCSMSGNILTLFAISKLFVIAEALKIDQPMKKKPFVLQLERKKWTSYQVVWSKGQHREICL